MGQSKLFTAVIILALLGAVVVGCGGPKDVTFPDENLEAAKEGHLLNISSFLLFELLFLC